MKRQLLAAGWTTACLTAFAACSDDPGGAATSARTTPDASPSASYPSVDSPIRQPWRDVIPPTVRVDRNLGPGRDGSKHEQSRRVHRASLRGICGDVPLDLDAGAIDRLGVDDPGEARTLYLYADATQAAQRLTTIKRWLSSCDADEEWGTNELRTSDLGESSLVEMTTDVGTGAGPAARWLRLVRVGNALLLTDSFEVASPGPALASDVRRQECDLRPLVRDLDAFRAPANSSGPTG